MHACADAYADADLSRSVAASPVGLDPRTATTLILSEEFAPLEYPCSQVLRLRMLYEGDVYQKDRICSQLHGRFHDIFIGQTP